MTDRPSREESARFLRQRLEMGAGEIFLEGMSREEVLEALRKVRQGRGASRDAGVAGGSVSATDVTTDAGTDAGAEDIVSSSGPQPDRRASPVLEASESDAPESDAPLPDDYDTLRELALGCTRCRLSKNRTQVVFSDGPRDARLMVVGEAPGANEDRTGLPFVGAAGKYLDLLLATVGLSREESVYIANVLKCRPPGNRDPKPDEIETCSPYLRKQIDLVRPEVLLAVGSFSGKLLTGRDNVALGKLRGAVHSYHGVPLVVTYHPAALLRNRRWTRAFWEDLQLLREVMDRHPTEAS